MTNFTRFLPQHLAEHRLPESLGGVLFSLVSACRDISGKVRLGALAGVLGEAGSGNVQGEAQKKLDVIANDMLVAALKSHPFVGGLASEEEDDFVACSGRGYLVLFDPLDGSSNIDVNISVGTIFSVLAQPEGRLNTAAFLQNGRSQLASGYVLYGPQTQLVLTVRHGVFVFTLDETGEFVLTRERPQIAPHTQEFAVNASNRRHWFAPVRQYIDELLAGDTGCRGKNYNMRWVASMVAEVHRILMRGGVFLYPQDARDPGKPGKLRLMYEANPMALLIEQAGGACSDTRLPMLDVVPEKLHQRVPVVLGSREEVEQIVRLHG
ncbi:class 1 fructose-bisphosphatase [Neisseria leonii]|uniref:Fructose-1,6-bisphosphatase class 1 n=1 Tax=Neisseria leonii TaxID=2995413 RepID=A0A9X4ID83_9NEIS|nr:class 1 fructose-bisphosphatase [Neisseria sp. 51.81]MDD9326922.1 class 1 fructose-bisphosphatase [Neisseria sp. 51.81]